MLKKINTSIKSVNHVLLSTCTVLQIRKRWFVREVIVYKPMALALFMSVNVRSQLFSQTHINSPCMMTTG